jgi:hypothetical protein
MVDTTIWIGNGVFYKISDSSSMMISATSPYTQLKSEVSMVIEIKKRKVA